MSFNDITVTPISRTVNVCDQWERINDAISDLLDAAKAHVNGSDDVHPASELDNDSGVSGSKIDNALDTLKGDIDNIVAGAVEDNAGWFNVNAGGTANAITGTYSGISALTGIKVALTVASANTDTVTFNLNSLGADTIKYYGLSGDKVELSGSNWVNGATIFLIHDGTDWMLLPNVIADIMAKQDRGEGLNQTEYGRYYDKNVTVDTNGYLYFQDSNDFTAGANVTLSTDTVNKYWGNASLKLLENDNVSSYNSAFVGGLTEDFSSVGTGDFLNMIFFISDVTYLNDISYYFETSAGNHYRFNINSGLATGLNIKKLAKSAATPTGAPDWSNITKIAVEWYSKINAQNEYVSFQLGQFIRVDPDDSTQPNYFQYQIDNGVYENSVIRGGISNHILGLENNEISLKDLGVTNSPNAITFKTVYSSNNDFIIKARLKLDVAGNSSLIQWRNDNNNRTGAYFEANNFRIFSIINASSTDIGTAITTAVGDIIDITVIKNKKNWSFQLKVNGVMQDISGLSQTSFNTNYQNLNGKLAIQELAGNPCYIQSATITSTKVADHANTADRAYRILQPSCRVYNDASISVNDSASTALTFNTERWDNNNIHSLSTNTDRLTCRKSGKYQICGNVAFAANATGIRQLHIKLNGSTILALSQKDAVAGGVLGTVIALSTQYVLDSGDYVQLLVYQNSGGALNVEYLPAYSPEFMMTKISD
jgi:hypothetical protein